MAHYGTLQNFGSFSQEAQDIRGSHVYGRDDKKLGKINDVIFDHTNGNIIYVVIDAGSWLTTKNFIVPANQLSESARHQDDYVVDLTKEQIEKFPPFDERDLGSDQAWSQYEGRYRDSWADGNILHREGSNRAVTPGPETTRTAAVRSGTSTPSAERRSMNSEQQEADVEAASRPDDRVFPAAGSEWARNAVPGAVGSRWDEFQQSLRSRRKEITSTCTQCGKAADAHARDIDRLRRTGT